MSPIENSGNKHCFRFSLVNFPSPESCSTPQCPGPPILHPLLSHQVLQFTASPCMRLYRTVPPYNLILLVQTGASATLQPAWEQKTVLVPTSLYPFLQEYLVVWIGSVTQQFGSSDKRVDLLSALPVDTVRISRVCFLESILYRGQASRVT